MKKLAWLMVLLVVPALSGCLSFLEDEENLDAVRPANVGYDPSKIRVTDVVQHELDLLSFDNVTTLSTVILEPRSPDALPDGSPPAWPVVVFLHGWGGTKESWMDGMGVEGAGVLEDFARAGMIVVAYDARGFGRSTGFATVAGPAELEDLNAVLDHVEARFATNGYIGVTGASYGAGQSLLAWAKNPRITTAVSQYGWTDLYDGLVPGNVPKVAWAQALYIGGAPASQARYDPMIHDWYQSMYSRANLERIQDEMASRSSLPLLAQTDKPLLVCQGMQETLFPQAHKIWENAGGFTRAIIYDGGHSVSSPECLEKTRQWFQYFLGGHDTGVDHWPALTTTDANGGRVITYKQFPASQDLVLYAREPQLAEAAYSNMTFTVQQRGINNPFTEPDFLWDRTGNPRNDLPAQMRQDPSGVFFTSAPLDEAQVLLGAPHLYLKHNENNRTEAYQVVASLYLEGENSRSRLLGRASYALVDGVEPAKDDWIALEFPWIKTNMPPGSKVVLKVAANDVTTYMPLAANYQVSFTGHSHLVLPLADL